MLSCAPLLSTPEGPAELVEDAAGEADAGAGGGGDDGDDAEHQQDPEGGGGPALAGGVLYCSFDDISKSSLGPAPRESSFEGVSFGGIAD